MSRADMLACLEAQREAYLREGVVTAAVRRDRLERAIGLLKTHERRLVEAMTEDFGHRSEHQSLFTDVAASVGPLRHAARHLERWMRPEKRKVGPFPLNLLGAKARVEFQPLGVVGVISPWNFPVNLTFTPLAGILAAGNRCMIKPSEYTAATSAVLAEIFPTAFDPLEIAVVTGGAQTGADFASLPFDHLLFTGATSVARHVMRAAADNLVPLTLELGGKSPVVVGRSVDMQPAVDSIMTGKLLNAGQICLAPDYVFVPRERVDDFVASAERAVGRMYPTLLDNPDYTSVINQRHFDRLNGYVEGARARGARVVEINPANEDFRQQPHHKIPPTLIVDPDDDLAVMQDEIFGPILPIKGYASIDEVLDYVNRRPRPLGLYYFGKDAGEERTVLTRTTSGGVTVNDVVMHVAQEDLPFGGVGPSGMGAYHGYDGFRTFSHAKAVFTQTRINVAELAGLRPPYGEKMLKAIRAQMR
ncbi:MAG: coniferyl aldehyde dehydrogenase [Pseudomonadales bacterium]|nr:coniferyl aldehyde dehydrogenase [Pseudomonadales bacterium]